MFYPEKFAKRFFQLLVKRAAVGELLRFPDLLQVRNELLQWWQIRLGYIDRLVNIDPSVLEYVCDRFRNGCHIYLVTARCVLGRLMVMTGLTRRSCGGPPLLLVRDLPKLRHSHFALRWDAQNHQRNDISRRPVVDRVAEVVVVIEYRRGMPV